METDNTGSSECPVVNGNKSKACGSVRGVRALFLISTLLFSSAEAQQVDSWVYVPSEHLFTLHGAPDSPFRQPTDVAQGPEGGIYVLDGLNGRVLVFSEKGEFRTGFGSPGNGPGQMDMAVGIGIAPSGEVFVADSGNHRILVFSSKGQFLRSFRLAKGQEADPTDVLPMKLENLCYVIDNDNHEVQAYDAKTGHLKFKFGGHGKNTGEFRYPSTIACDRQNNLYVVDVMNSRVQTFTPFGTEPREITNWGVTVGKVFRPKGVAIDGKGDVIVSDSFTGTLQVFRKNGELIGVVGTPEGKMRKFTTPTNIVVDSLGRLIVVETKANQVSVYRLPQR